MSMKKYDDVQALIAAGNIANNTNATYRLNPVPMDSSSIYKNFADASNYALSDGAAYEGQVVAVTQDGRQVLYVLDSAPDVSATGLRRAGAISADELCGITAYAKVEDLSAGAWNTAYSVVSGISSYSLTPYKLAVSSLADVSSALCMDQRGGSNVYIKNPDSAVLSDGVKSDLSVIKIRKDEYDAMAARECLSGNCLYVVSSDYMDAYGQVMANLSTPDAVSTGFAANVPFVQQVSSSISERVSVLEGSFDDVFSRISSDSTISAFWDTVNGEDEVDQVELELAVSALYRLVGILARK